MPIQRTGSAENVLFLRQVDPTTTALAGELWDKYSGAPGLLNAAVSPLDSKNGRYRTGYVFHPETGKYTRADNGMTVSDKQLRNYVNNVSSEVALRMKKETQQLIAGLILLSVWHEQMRSLMSALYRTVWVLSIGGWLFDDDTQRNLFYLFVLSQFNWLDNFYYQLEHDIQPLNGSAMARAGMYGEFGNALWQNIKLDNAIKAGATEAKRVLGPNENHCNDSADRRGCLELEKQSWMPIEQMTPIGGATCYNHCLCEIITR